MSDEMIVALAANGGALQINFGSAFLSQSANEQSLAFFASSAAFAEEQALDEDDPAMEEFGATWWEDNPRHYADLADVVAHIDHVVDLVGIDHVGFGSDFDGVGDSLPEGLKDSSQYPNLIAALLEAGYTEEEVGKISSGNVLRVWEAVEQIAAESGADA